ncbi:MAG TPA: hypothetical protein VKM72_05405 [Thermoanaerobaculia bacterium]|nr:hypothetical protein [Thermoanaerobaculia bacterium]
MTAPREAMDCLDTVHSFVDRHLPDLSEPATAAAVEIYFVTQGLQLATQALEARRVEDRISDKRSETERAILQVLAENRGRYMRRGEIHEALKLPEPVTPARVGQILVELHAENVVVRIHGRAQGNPNAAFYALSPRGVELCMSLGLVGDELGEEQLEGVAAGVLPEPGEAAGLAQRKRVLQEAAQVALDPARNQAERLIARGLLASSCVGPLKSFVLGTLTVVAGEREENKAAQELANETFKEVLDARSVDPVEPRRPGMFVLRRESRQPPLSPVHV